MMSKPLHGHGPLSGAAQRLSAQGGPHAQLLLGPNFGLVPENMWRNPPWLQPLRRALGTADCKRLFPRLDRGEGAPEVAAHQTLLSELIHGLKQPDVQIEALFTDRRWRLVRSFAPRKSWLAVLEKNGFPCSREIKLPAKVDPATDLIEIGQYADASREQVLVLTLWLAPSLRALVLSR
jgi:hypothetical protein